MTSQLDAFPPPDVFLALAVAHLEHRRGRRLPRVTPDATPLGGTRDAAEFVRACLVEYRKAERTEAACRCMATKLTLSDDERSAFRDRMDAANARLVRVELALTERLTSPPQGAPCP